MAEPWYIDVIRVRAEDSIIKNGEIKDGMFSFGRTSKKIILRDDENNTPIYYDVPSEDSHASFKSLRLTDSNEAQTEKTLYYNEITKEITFGDNATGLPEGGTTGQALVKKTNNDYDVEWSDVSGAWKVLYDGASIPVPQDKMPTGIQPGDVGKWMGILEVENGYNGLHNFSGGIFRVTVTQSINIVGEMTTVPCVVVFRVNSTLIDSQKISLLSNEPDHRLGHTNQAIRSIVYLKNPNTNEYRDAVCITTTSSFEPEHNNAKVKVEYLSLKNLKFPDTPDFTNFTQIKNVSVNAYPSSYFINSDYSWNGLPTGGTKGETIIKKSNSDFDTEWGTLSASDVGAEPTLTKGDLSASGSIAVDNTRQVIGGSCAISHLTTTGHKHIPASGASGDILGWSSDGTATWISPESQSWASKWIDISDEESGLSVALGTTGSWAHSTPKVTEGRNHVFAFFHTGYVVNNKISTKQRGHSGAGFKIITGNSDPSVTLQMSRYPDVGDLQEYDLITFDISGLNLKSGSTYKINNVDIASKWTAVTGGIYYGSAGAQSIGVGVQPELWQNVFNAIQVGKTAAFFGTPSTNSAYFTNNVYYNTTWKALMAGYGSRMGFDSNGNIDIRTTVNSASAKNETMDFSGTGFLLKPREGAFLFSEKASSPALTSGYHSVYSLSSDSSLRSKDDAGTEFLLNAWQTGTSDLFRNYLNTTALDYSVNQNTGIKYTNVSRSNLNNKISSFSLGVYGQSATYDGWVNLIACKPTYTSKNTNLQIQVPDTNGNYDWIAEFAHNGAYCHSKNNFVYDGSGILNTYGFTVYNDNIEAVANRYVPFTGYVFGSSGSSGIGTIALVKPSSTTPAVDWAFQLRKTNGSYFEHCRMKSTGEMKFNSTADTITAEADCSKIYCKDFTAGNATMFLKDETLSGVTREEKAICANGRFTGTWTGMTTTVTGVIKWQVTGKLVTLFLPQTTGTSNSSSMTITGLPEELYPITTTPTIPVTVIDNGVIKAGLAIIGLDGVINIEIGIISTNRMLYSNDFATSSSKGTPKIPISYELY